MYRELFARHGHSARRAEANESVLDILNRTPGTREFTRKYVEGTDPIDLALALADYGLEVNRVGARTRITVAARLNREQQSLLRDFGYNLQRR